MPHPPTPQIPTPPPTFPAAQLTEAVARQNRGDLAGAQAIYWQILLDQPDQFDALHLLGVSKCQQGLRAEGAWFIDRALRLRPGDTNACFNRATALAELHRHTEAIAAFDATLALAPSHAAAWSSRADALQMIGRHADAIDSYHRALALDPARPGTCSNLANALLATGQTDQALPLFHQALAGGADPATVQTSIGRAHLERGDIQAADQAFQAALLAAPDSAQPRWLQALATLPDIPETTAQTNASRPAFANAINAIDQRYAQDQTPGQGQGQGQGQGRGQGHRRDRLEHAWPFFLAYQDHDNRALLSRFADLRTRLVNEWRARQTLPAREIGPPSYQAPIRLAIVSPHLYSHSVWHAITRGWFTHHDPARIHIHAFHTGPKTDAETDHARSRATTFTQGERPLIDWIAAIQACKPDAILYPAIGMDVMTANLATLRLAPVQLATWGHPETTGLNTIDAYLSAQAFEPPGETAYTERLIRLPRLGVSVAAPTTPATTPLDDQALHALGLDPTRAIILCPGTPFKYAPENDPVLTAILHGVPDAQLVFFHAKTGTPQSQRLQNRLARHLAAAEFEPAHHLRLVSFMQAAAFHALLARADACLDTIGFSGFNTALHALQSHAPLVAFEGQFMRGRLASGILRTLGLHDLVATTRETFAKIAIRLTTTPAWRKHLRAQIAASLPALYEDRAAVTAWMDEIEKMVRNSAATAAKLPDKPKQNVNNDPKKTEETA